MTGPGLDDIEVAHSGLGFLENTVMVFENRGGLTFQSCPVPVGPQPTSVQPDDVDGDGRMDLVVVNAGDGEGEGSVMLRMNNSLQPPTWTGPDFAVGVNPRTVRCVDLNNDGKREIVSANVGDGTLSVLVNTGTPSAPAFAPQVALPAGNLNGSITALDLDHDGDRDLAAIADGQVRILRNDLTQGQIAFAPGAPPTGGTGEPILLDQADVDGDNRSDLITLREGADTGALTDTRPNTSPGLCYPNCDQSTQQPVLNVADFTCFLQRYASGQPYANCDASTQPPVLNVADFTCFLQRYAQGCP